MFSSKLKRIKMNSDSKRQVRATFITKSYFPTISLLGEGPQTLMKEDISFGVLSTNTCIHPQAPHYVLSDFLVETHFDPCKLSR